MADDKQMEFLTALNSFILSVQVMPSFRGKTQVIRALRRISGMAIFG